MVNATRLAVEWRDRGGHGLRWDVDLTEKQVADMKREEWVPLRLPLALAEATLAWNEIAWSEMTTLHVGIAEPKNGEHAAFPSSMTVASVSVVNPVDMDSFDYDVCPKGRFASDLMPPSGLHYGNCIKCCCELEDERFDDQRKHCFDHGDVVAEVNPLADPNPNQACQVCDRAWPDIRRPITTALESTSGRVLQGLLAYNSTADNTTVVMGNATLNSSMSVDNDTTTISADVPCNDFEACTWDDRCTDKGLCIATPYTNCLQEDFQAGDPARDCETCDGSGPFSPTLGCKARPGHYVFAPGTEGRVCGCFIDGEVWPHLATRPGYPCMKCDVTIDNTAWVNKPDDIICNLKEQWDYYQTHE
jgi:hypothetical protein